MFSIKSLRWLKQALSASKKRKARARAKPFCPRLEALEDRTVPAVLTTATWVGGTVGSPTEWNVATNWFPAVVPNNNTPANGIDYAVDIETGTSGTPTNVDISGIN